MAVRFDEKDLQLFSDASGDRNPLHMSAAYASRTAYGQQVVFGALGGLASLGQIEIPADYTISRLTADFHRPLFLDVNYEFKIAVQGETHTVRMFDGSVPVLTLSVLTKPGKKTQAGPEFSALFEHADPVRRSEQDCQAGFEVSGLWRADPALLSRLRERWNIEIDPFIVETLLFGSYLVGMDLPGLNALFFKFSLNFQEQPATAEPFLYRARALNYNRQIAQLRMAVSLSSGDAEVASGQFLSFIRPELASQTFDLVSDAGSLNELAGKVALIVGASRGLGATLCSALVMRGAHVIGLSRSPAPEIEAQISAEAAAHITFFQGDATDLQWLQKTRELIAEKFARIDFLICNAFPPIPALRLEPNSFARLHGYINQATDLVLAPLCAFLDLLNESQGCAVIISSVAVEEPVREWPHYVAAKNAIEAFARIAPLQFPRTGALIVRPERLLTEMTNTPMGRQDALPPSRLASQIASRLGSPPAPGSVEVVHYLPDEAPANHKSVVLGR